MKNSTLSISIMLVILLLSLTTFNNLLAQSRVVLPGAFQSEVSNNTCSDWMADCYSTELIHQAGTSIYVNSFTIPAGCWEFKVALNGSWSENYGKGGLYGANLQLTVPEVTLVTFQYDSVTHLVSSTPYNESSLAPTKVSLYGNLQSESGCTSNYDLNCDNPALTLNPGTGKWEGKFNLPAGCYSYLVKETSGCDGSTPTFGENGVLFGNYIQLYIPSEGEIAFSYDGETHIITSTPYTGAPTRVSLYGTLQSELGCSKDYDTCGNSSLTYNDISGKWEATFTLPPGCYSYFVIESVGCFDYFYGDNGIRFGSQIQLYVPVEGEITFSYDSQTHIMSSTPYSGAPQVLNKVTLMGDFQNELGCANDFDYRCDNTLLVFNSSTGNWEGKFTLPAGCYQYQVKETTGCSTDTVYGENGVASGSAIKLYIPVSGEVSFVYNSQTHIINSTPDTDPSQITAVSLIGDLQSELGCGYDFNYTCDVPALSYNTNTGKWEGSVTLPAGCYQYLVAQTMGCDINNKTYYGQDGNAGGVNYYMLYIPAESEISFSYDPETHIMSATPNTPYPAKVSLLGSLQSELGCANDNDNSCDNPALLFNTASGKWEAKFNLPAGCYQYQVKESINCFSSSLYGENGVLYGTSIQLYIPVDGEITFSYDPQTHIITTTPFTPIPETITKVSLRGNLQSELGCPFDNTSDCDNPAFNLNAESGKWEGKFILPAGCYQYDIKETIGCFNISYYGVNGVQSGNSVPLYVPAESEINFSYDPQTHLISSTPYSGDAQTVSNVSLYGSLQSELAPGYYDYDPYDNVPALTFNPTSGEWEAKFTLPAGCYQYMVKESIGCYASIFYDKNGVSSGNFIQLYIPAETEITFSYNPETHIITTTPYYVYQTVVSLYGSLQSESGCSSDWEYDCNNPALIFNAASGKWESKFTLPAGCYQYYVRESPDCLNSVFYGEDGIISGNYLQLYVPAESEISFSYNPETHIITTTPYSVYQPVVSLLASFQSETGCPFDFYYNCNNPALTFNSTLGKWEGTFTLPAGCHQYLVKESTDCYTYLLYGDYGIASGNYIQLYIPADGEVSFSYDPQTHIITSSPYSGVPATAVSLVGDMQSILGCSYDWNYWDCNMPAFTFNSSSGLWEGAFHLNAGCYNYIVKRTDVCNTTYFYAKDGKPGAESSTLNRYQLYLPEATDVILKFDPVTNLIISDYEDLCPPAIVNIPGSFQSELGCLPNFYNGDWEPACDATRLVYDPVSKLFIGTFNIPAGSFEYKIAYNNSWEENYGLDGIHYGANIPLELCEPSKVTFSYNYKTHLVDLTFNPTAICVTKFYDANLNGINDDSMPVAGIQFKLSGKRNSVQYKFTGTDGRVAFSGLTAGNYIVREKLPPNWVATTSEVQQVALNAPASLSFGNVCLGSGGGHNKFYWISWKGEAALNDDNTMTPELSMLSALNLRNKDGSDFDPADYQELKKWLKNENSRSRAYGLSVQLAVLQLNVEAGFVNGNAIVYAAGCGSQGYANGFITVNELISKANLALAVEGYHRKDGRSNFECLDNAIENANSDLGFVQPLPCTLCNTPVSSRPVIDIDPDTDDVSGKAKIWPNPSNGFFTLRPATAVSNEKILLRVFDAAGKLVYTDNGNANKNYQFGSAFKPGLYFVEVLQGKNRETFKVVKE